jgi:hypothetical protein
MSNIPQRHKLEFYKNLLIKVNQLIEGKLNLYFYKDEIEGKIKMLESSKVTREDVQVDWKNIRNKPTFIPDNKEGALHWYQVRLLYRRKGDMNPTFDFQTQIGLTNQKDILNARILKKTLPPLHKSNNPWVKATKKFLNNGILYTELICYLGYFSEE